MGNGHDKVYDQVAVPSAGGTVPASKGSSVTTPCEALGNPGRYNRTVPVAAKERGHKEATEEQVGTNMELTWTRHGGDKPSPITDQSFKNNFHNPTEKA
jgi:hypothetical protein